MAGTDKLKQLAKTSVDAFRNTNAAQEGLGQAMLSNLIQKGASTAGNALQGHDSRGANIAKAAADAVGKYATADNINNMMATGQNIKQTVQAVRQGDYSQVINAQNIDAMIDRAASSGALRQITGVDWQQQQGPRQRQEMHTPRHADPVRAYTDTVRENLALKAEADDYADMVMGHTADEIEYENERRNMEVNATVEEIRQTAQNIKRTQMAANAETEASVRAARAAKVALAEERNRQSKLRKAVSQEAFSWWGVAPLIREGATLKQALTGAGCILNTKYALDYQGRTFIMVEDDHLDCICNTVRQNMMLERWDPENRAVIITGYEDIGANYSVGLLLRIPDFGVVLLKNNKFAEQYPTSLGKKMYDHGFIHGGYKFDEVALSKTHIKVAFTNAICVDMHTGKIETPEDVEYFKNNCEINPAYKEVFQQLIQSLDQ